MLEIDNLHTDIVQKRGTVHAVNGVSLTVKRGEILGVVGESGCGKTMTGMSILRLLPNGGVIAEGSIKVNGKNVVTMGKRDLQNVRGNDVAVVFQDPMTSLNPVMRIGHQISEAVLAHKKVSPEQARQRALEVLELVGVPRPQERLKSYPHQLSGGLRQRVVIAIALACQPTLLIADEPTTALDVTIQAQILALLEKLRRDEKMGILLITHDMGVIAGHADRVIVMYAGQVVEDATTDELFSAPHHPYTEALLQSIPRLDQKQDEALYSIPGIPPDLSRPMDGCRFAPRCRYATDDCRAAMPALTAGPHGYRCFHPVGNVPASSIEATRETA